MTSSSSSRLQIFVASVSPADIEVLVNYLAERADEYITTGRQIANSGGKEWRLRSVHHQSMAQALFSLADRINQEKEQQAHGNQQPIGT